MASNPVARCCAIASLVFGVFATSQSSAQTAPTVDCDTLPLIIYGMGGSAHMPFIRDLAVALANATPPQTLTYNSTQGACSGVNAIVDGRTVIPATTTYWNAAGLEGTCNVTAPVTQYADFGLLGNEATLCTGIESSELHNVRTVRGPVGTVNVLVPNGSSEFSISSEALHFIYRYGPGGGVSPWVGANEDIIRRNNSNFAKLQISLAVGLPTTFTFAGVDASPGSGNVITTLLARPDPNLAIGFAPGDVADENRAVVRTLAYQHTGQHHAYLPDSAVDTFDKANVRSGQYYLWDYAYFYARYDTLTGLYESTAAARLLGYVEGSVPTPASLDLFEVTTDAAAVPVCAMRVAREGTLTPLYSHAPDAPCGCAFDARATGTTTCTACTGGDGVAGTCPGVGGANVCRRGYCEGW